MTDATPPTSAPSQPPSSSKPALVSGRAIAVFLIVTLVMTAADLYLKYWSFEHVADQPVVLTDLAASAETHNQFWAQYPHDPIVVVPGVLHFRLTTNTGAVFGLGKGGRWVFVLVSVVATFVIGLMFARSRADAWLSHAALALILSGALGNLYDRAVYGAVRDMLHMLPDTELWPWIFNLADAQLMLGVGLVLVLTFMSDRKRKQLQSASEKAPS